MPKGENPLLGGSDVSQNCPPPLLNAIALFRIKIRHEQRSTDEDHDHEAEAGLRLEEETTEEIVLRGISDIMHSLFGVCGQDILPFFDTLLPYFAALLAPGRSNIDRQWGLCVFDDLIEFCKEISFRYQEHFLSCMVESMMHPNPAVRQVSPPLWLCGGGATLLCARGDSSRCDTRGLTSLSAGL